MSQASVPIPASSPASDAVFVARQPIMDEWMRTHAYELLYRSGPENAFPKIDPTVATARVMATSTAALPLSVVTGGRPAFVNFTRELLLGGQATLFPPERLVIELLEEIEPDPEVAAACRDLRRRGYRLALDDVVRLDDNPLFGLVDIVKVDFTLTPLGQRRALATALSKRNLTLVAEKVETRFDLDQAVELGYTLFQGYFLSRPALLSGAELPSSMGVCSQLLALVQDDPLDLEKIERTVKREVALVDGLLRLLNSAVFGWREQIRSVRHGLVLIGETQVRRWVSLLALSELGGGKPAELITMSLVRAHMCEALGEALPEWEVTHAGLDYYLTGMYSLIDVLLDRPLPAVLAALPLSSLIEAALLGTPNPLRRVLDVVTTYESGNWTAAARLAAALGLREDLIATTYSQALSATEQMALG